MRKHNIMILNNSLNPFSFFSSPSTLITTNFLKSFEEVGLICPEFQPQAKKNLLVLVIYEQVYQCMF